MNYDSVVHHMTDKEEAGTDRGKPGTLADFLSLAGLHTDRAMYEKVKKEVEAQLAPGKALADLVGTKVFPEYGRKKAERWAKDRDLEMMKSRPRTRRPPRGYLYAALTKIIAISDNMPEGPRKLSPETIDYLEDCRNIDISKDDAPKIISLIRGLLHENREMRHILEILDTVKETTAANTSLVQRMLTHEKLPQETNSESKTIN